MRWLSFITVLLVGSLVGCAPVTATVVPQEPNSPAVEPTVEPEPPAPTDPLAELNAASQELVITTHYLRHWSVVVRRYDQEQLWDRGFTAWLYAVDRWLGSASRLSRERSYADTSGRLSIMLDMERHLADLAQARERMSWALLRSRNSDVCDAVQPHLIRAIQAIEQAEQALYNLENPATEE